MSELYFKKALTSMEPYDPEIHDDTWLTVNRVSISEHDRANGSPKIGDMIASNPKARDDKWLVNEKYLKENYELDTRPDDAKWMIAEKLWDLLDNIDTASDMFKPSRTNGYSSFENFYNYAMKESEKRHLLMKSDGYTLETCKQSEGSE